MAYYHCSNSVGCGLIACSLHFMSLRLFWPYPRLPWPLLHGPLCIWASYLCSSMAVLPVKEWIVFVAKIFLDFFLLSPLRWLSQVLAPGWCSSVYDGQRTWCYVIIVFFRDRQKDRRPRREKERETRRNWQHSAGVLLSICIGWKIFAHWSKVC